MFPDEDNAHVAEAEGMLIGQYRGLPNVTALIALAGARAQLVENTFWIVTASQRVSRTFPPGNAQGELDGAPDQALLQVADLVGAPVGTWTTRELALLVQVWILARKSQGRAVDILGILLAAFGVAAFNYLEEPPASFEVWVPSVPDASLVAPIAQALAIARPPGVYAVLDWGAWPADPPLPGVALTGTFFLGYGIALQGSGLKNPYGTPSCEMGLLAGQVI